MTRRPPAVARVLERVTATVREHDMFSPGDRVLVAVSGGPDSVCLLYSLWMLRRLFKIQLEVFHFDHGLRPDSAKDAAYVKRLATKLDLPFHVRVAESKPAKGDSPEDWAHRVRFRALFGILRERDLPHFALGHTMDDHAETVLLALMRGAGLEAVPGMAPSGAGGVLLHPLLDVRRQETHSFVRALGLRPRNDPTNRDTRLMRNGLRLRGIPALERSVGRDIVGPIARSAALLAIDRDYIHNEFRGLLGEGTSLDLLRRLAGPDAAHGRGAYR